MKKISLIGFLSIFAILIFNISSFAANNIATDAMDGVRNIVGGAENVVEDTAKDITGGIRNRCG